MKFIGIYKKLISFVTWVLVVAIGLYFVSGIVIEFFDARRDMRRAEDDIRDNLSGKGRLLVSNNSRALRGMAEDNAFGAITQLVAATVSEDKDVEYGIYMDSGRQPWVYADSEGVKLDNRMLDDPVSVWAHNVSSVSSKEIDSQGAVIIEFAAPVTSNGERLGTIRYGFNTKTMRQKIAAAKETALTRGALNIILLVGIGIIIFFVAARAARKWADTIAGPLGELTEAADSISKGDYSISVDVSTDDEVGVLAISFETMRHTIREYTENLEHKVAERTKQIQSMQKKLVEQAHKSGMADIATAVIHNIGNILNSAMTSGELIKDTTGSSHLSGFKKANLMLRENLDNIETFIRDNPKGKKLLSYYLALEEMMVEEHQTLEKHSDRLLMKIDAIREVIFAQQSYASGGSLSEELHLAEVLEDTLKLQEGAIARHNMHVVKDFKEVPHFFLPRTKLMQITMNLFKNAKEAMWEREPDEKVLTVSVYREGDYAYMKVSDTGCGIPEENLKKIFNHGFTTKKTGHGFGLHSCANYMAEMGGKIWAESDGVDKGATFILQFEIKSQ